MKIVMISFTGSGCELSIQAAHILQAAGHETDCYTKSAYTGTYGVRMVTESLKEWTKRAFGEADAIIFFGACGIAVRSIAPYVADKKRDPAVLVMDEQGKFLISLLSGHLGGANELTEYLARKIGACPVITTATDLNQKFAVDVFAKKNRCHIGDMTIAKEISAGLLAGERIGLVSEFPLEGRLPSGLEASQGDVLDPSIGIRIGLKRKEGPFLRTLSLTPRIVTLGIGCRKGISRERIEQAVSELLDRLEISIEAVEQVSTIDIKREEPGLCAFCEAHKLPLTCYGAWELEKAPGIYQESEFVRKQVGVGSVCERSAVLASGNGKIIHGKYARDGVTVAAAIREWSVNFE